MKIRIRSNNHVKKISGLSVANRQSRLVAILFQILITPSWSNNIMIFKK